MEIFGKYGGVTSGIIGPFIEMALVKQVKPELVSDLTKAAKNAIGMEICPEWLPRVGQMFEISELPCRGFGVKSHVLCGCLSSGIKWAQIGSDKFHELMKKMEYPGYEEGEWASYGTMYRGASGKPQELDVGYDRKNVESCDWRDKYLEEFLKGMGEAGVPPYIMPLSAFAYLTAIFKTLLKEEPLEVVMGPKGAEIQQGIRDITDPDRIMHRHRDLDTVEAKL